MASILYSCKKKSLEQRTEKIQQTQTTTTPPPKDTNLDMNDNSFTLSCGTGCAAAYTAENISQDKSSVTVKFKVENYMNNEQAETNHEVYVFYYNTAGGVDKIINEETHRNILEEYVFDVQESFKEFAASLVKDKKVDVSKFKGAR